MKNGFSWRSGLCGIVFSTYYVGLVVHLYTYMIFETYNKSPWLNFGVNSSFPKHPFSVSKPIKFFPTSTLKSIESSEGKRKENWIEFSVDDVKNNMGLGI